MSNRFIAIDWGTTNRRLYVIDGTEVVATSRDDQGILSVPSGGFQAAVLELKNRYGGLPMLLAGMVGSNRGWHDAGYVAAPAGIAELAEKLVSPLEGVAIVPGVCRDADGRQDVMRGEEVQLLGAVAAGLTPADALLCQPGTHAKWATIQGGTLTDFTTAMTGEMFAMLKANSLIASEMASEVDADPEFHQGLEASAHGDLLALLFGVRAASVLGARSSGAAAPYVSGVLLGTDCRARIAPGQTVYLLADGLLARLYSLAISIAGGVAVVIDSHASFVAGATRIWNHKP